MKNLTKSSEDYLETIYVIKMQQEKVKSVDVARILNVSKPGVNKAMNVLKEMGFIEKDYYSDIVLTEEGEKRAKEIYNKHVTLKNFLLKLGVSKENSEIDCCKMEHVISDETFKAIEKFVKGE